MTIGAARVSLFCGITLAVACGGGTRPAEEAVLDAAVDGVEDVASLPPPGDAPPDRTRVPDGGLREDAGGRRDAALAAANPSCPVQTLATLDRAAADIAVDDDHVYVSQGGGIWRLPKAGGALEPVLVGLPASAVRLELRGSDLYWVETAYTGPPEYYVETLRRASKDGAGAATIATSVLAFFETGGDRLVFVTGSRQAGSTAALETAARDGSDRRVVARRAFGRGLYADGEALYWVEGLHEAATTWTLSLAGGEARVWRPGLHYLVAADHDSVYAMSPRLDPATGEQWQVLRLPRDGSAPLRLAGIVDPSDEGDYRFARDGDFLYWSDETGHALRVPIAGGALASLGSGSGFDVDDSFPPLLVAVDGAYAYWQVAPPGGVPEAPERGPFLLVRACK